MLAKCSHSLGSILHLLEPPECNAMQNKTDLFTSVSGLGDFPYIFLIGSLFASFGNGAEKGKSAVEHGQDQWFDMELRI